MFNRLAQEVLLEALPDEAYEHSYADERSEHWYDMVILMKQLTFILNLQLVLAPHFYCPGVSGADACYAGATQWMAYDDTVGYLTRSPGYCKGGTCKVPPSSSATLCLCSYADQCVDTCGQSLQWHKNNHYTGQTLVIAALQSQPPGALPV